MDPTYPIREAIDKRTRVVLVSPTTPPAGGIGVWTDSILGGLARHPEVEVELVDTAVRWRRPFDLDLSHRFVGGCRQAFRDLARTRQACIRFQPAVVHLCSSGRLAVIKDYVILRWLRRQGIRSVYHLHMGRIPSIYADGSREWRMTTAACGLADAVAVLDRESFEICQKHFGQAKVVQLPNAIPIVADSARLRRPGSQDPVQVLFVGWVIPTKGINELIRACTDLKTENFRLTIVGSVSEEMRRTLERQIRTSGIAHKVTITGEVDRDEVARYLQRSDLLALPSYSEGFPMSILEAMAAGLPIVATAVGAIPEMVRDPMGDAGILVKVKDAAALRDALRSLLRDEGLRERLGAAGREIVRRRYALDRVTSSLVDLWQSLA